MKPFEIFRPGRHTPMSGEAIDFADSDIADMASCYDPGTHHAPMCVGHPQTDGPAYGWIDKLDVVGNRLVATPGDVEPAFAELVKQKRFRKVSASFYPPNGKGNPTPGKYHLRHVAFLGAHPPSVKGLKEIDFGENDDVVTIEFGEWTMSEISGSTARLFRRFRDWMIAKDGIEAADEAIPDWEIQSLERQSIKAEPASPVFAEPPANPQRTSMTETTTGPDAAELQRRTDDLASREAAFAERERQTRADADAAFVKSIGEAGRLPIGLQATAVALFAELDAVETIQFGEGDAAKTTTPHAAFREFLSALPIPVVTGEIATGKEGDVDFSDPAVIADLIVTEIDAAKAKGEELSSAQAIARIQQRASK